MEQRLSDFQPGPRLGNPYLEDPALRRYLDVFLAPCTDAAQRRAMADDLTSFGDKACGPYLDMAANAERVKPELEQYDQWGRRVDRVHVSEGWKYFKRESAVEGLVAIPYEHAAGERPPASARLHQAAKLLLFAPSSGMFSCPLAMTDGANAALRALIADADADGTDDETDLSEATVTELREACAHLTSRDPEAFWTSGQWFTEKNGGSDLTVATQTYALDHRSPTSTHALTGMKWFTSAVDADMSLTLATPVAAVPELHRERKPLALFFLKVRDSRESRDGHGGATAERESGAEAAGTALPLPLASGLNGIRIVRLKDKMATRQLPTAELALEGCHARLLSRRGLKNVLPMLTITRLHNSISAVGCMLRVRSLAVDFARQRHAFGQPIARKPLHAQSLVALDRDARGNLLLVLEVARLLGRVEAGTSSEAERAALRVLTSLVKFFTALECTRLMSEGVELFGAIGLMHNHVSTLFRDAAVLPVWEGTSNTMSLDLVRAATREPGAVAALGDAMRAMAQGPQHEDLRRRVDDVMALLVGERLTEGPQQVQLKGPALEWNARRLTDNLSRLFVCALAARMAADTQAAEDQVLLAHWRRRVEREREPMTEPEEGLHELLPKDMDGAERDDRGKPRAML